jgi:hypothetical protein
MVGRIQPNYRKLAAKFAARNDEWEKSGKPLFSKPFTSIG